LFDFGLLSDFGFLPMYPSRITGLLYMLL